MVILKELIDDQFYLYMNGTLIYKRWLSTGQSLVFDVMAYDKYTSLSITDKVQQNQNPKFVSVKARLQMYSAANGGRKSGFISGYRPNHVFEHTNDGLIKAFMGDIIFDDRPTVGPGETVIVTVRFLIDQHLEQYLTIGTRWWIHEGNKPLGEAEMLGVELN